MQISVAAISARRRPNGGRRPPLQRTRCGRGALSFGGGCLWPASTRPWFLSRLFRACASATGSPTSPRPMAGTLLGRPLGAQYTPLRADLFSGHGQDGHATDGDRRSPLQQGEGVAPVTRHGHVGKSTAGVKKIISSQKVQAEPRPIVVCAGPTASTQTQCPSRRGWAARDADFFLPVGNSIRFRLTLAY